MHRGLNCNRVQTSVFSVSALKLEMSGLAVAVKVSQSGTGGSEASVSESIVCEWYRQHSDVTGA